MNKDHVSSFDGKMHEDPIWHIAPDGVPSSNKNTIEAEGCVIVTLDKCPYSQNLRRKFDVPSAEASKIGNFTEAGDDIIVNCSKWENWQAGSPWQKLRRLPHLTPAFSTAGEKKGDFDMSLIGYHDEWAKKCFEKPVERTNMIWPLLPPDKDTLPMLRASSRTMA